MANQPHQRGIAAFQRRTLKPAQPLKLEKASANNGKSAVPRYKNETSMLIMRLFDENFNEQQTMHYIDSLVKPACAFSGALYFWKISAISDL